MKPCAPVANGQRCQLWMPLNEAVGSFLSSDLSLEGRWIRGTQGDLCVLVHNVRIHSTSATVNRLSGASIGFTASYGCYVMSVLQIRDVLGLIRGYHQGLAERLQSLSGHVSDERVCMLLEYMAVHELSFVKTLASYQKDAGEGVLNTWLQFVPDDAIGDALSRLEFSAEMPAAEILNVVLAFDRALIEMYRELAAESSVPHVQELFANLLDQEERKDRKFSISVLELADE